MDDEEFDRLLEDELDLLRELDEAEAATAPATVGKTAPQITPAAPLPNALTLHSRKRPLESKNMNEYFADEADYNAAARVEKPGTQIPIHLQSQPQKRPRREIEEPPPQPAPPSPLPPPPPRPSAAPAWRYHRTVPTNCSDFCSVTGQLGQRIYLPVRDQALLDALPVSATTAQLASAATSGGGQRLRDAAMAENRRRQRRLAALSLLRRPGVDSGAGATPAEELWVSKYAPRTYLDLLSDERTNRALLHWLKTWDHVAFGRPRRQQDLGPVAAAPDSQQQQQLENQPPEFDEWGRPFYKVVLLWGAPGRGKTTLAHTAARQCGYHVVEMNASDDRSVEQFRTRLDAVTRSQGSISGGGASLVPGCLVLDEIDGAPEPAIATLVACVKASPAAAGCARGKRGGGSGGALMRPVICVCNDPFAPALRHLRPLALQLRLPDPPLDGLVSRLLEVCRAEGLAADRLDVTALAGRFGGDLRSCLHAMQFMGEAGLGGGSSTKQHVVGLKDTGEGLMSTLGRLFSRQPMDAQSLASCAESDERLVECLFHNYPHGARDTQKAAAAADWLRYHDMLSAAASFGGRQTESFVLARYAPYSILACRPHLACRRPPRLSLPPPELRAAAAQRAGLARGFLADLAPACRVTSASLVLDLAPSLLEILQPGLRSVSTQLYTARERQDLAAVVDCMICYGLQYTQQRTLDGQTQFLLEPPLDQLVRFVDPSSSSSSTTSTAAAAAAAVAAATAMPGRRPPLSGAVRQLLARELQSERLRRAETAAAARLGGPAAAISSSKTPERPARRLDTVRAATTAMASSPAAAAAAAAAASGPVPVSRDFFGRPIVASASAKQRPPAAPPSSTSAPCPTETPTETRRRVLNQRIWYRFNEGFSNAVRRPVRVRAFRSMLGLGGSLDTTHS